MSIRKSKKGSVQGGRRENNNTNDNYSYNENLRKNGRNEILSAKQLSISQTFYPSGIKRKKNGEQKNDYCKYSCGKCDYKTKKS